MELVPFLNKWIHLLSIIGVLGGTAFAWIVLSPSGVAETETGPQLWKRFGIAVGILWVVVLATGFINLAIVSPKVNSGYQMLLGIKMALAVAMFLLTLLVAHPMPALARFFQNRRGWLLLMMVFGIAIVGISAHLNISRIDRSGLKAAVPAAQ